MKPSRRTREEACELLSAAASQREWIYGCRTMPGFDRGARELAEAALNAAGAGQRWYVDDRWPFTYAEAECLLRTGWMP